MAEPMAMFPLGSVLFPGESLPLHVFEPRYRELIRRCLAGTPEFGVTLIERGSEVGGGDVRFDVGCVARIAQVAELDDGRYAVIAVGARRIEVVRWLDDDPYPRAEVAERPEVPPTGDPQERIDAVLVVLRRVLAMASELGAPGIPSEVELDPDPVAATYQLAALAPVGPLDRLALLAAPTGDERLALLGELLDDAAVVLASRLGGI
jgi:uncharacterized protein